MLARLDAVAGVRECRVDASGRFFLLELEPGANREAVLAGARAVLGRSGRPVEADEAAAQLSARDRGDPWYAARDTLALCYLEARVLSVRIGAAAASAADLAATEAERVTEAARAVLFEVMERVHGEGGRPSSGWFYDQWPAIAARIGERSRGLLPETAAARVADAVARLYARGQQGDRP